MDERLIQARGPYLGIQARGRAGRWNRRENCVEEPSQSHSLTKRDNKEVATVSHLRMSLS